MPYVDGFVLPVPQDRIADYTKIAEAAAEIWKDHGALEYWECLGDDLNAEGSRSFVDLAQARDGENVVFAWVVFESREARDAANKKICNDPRMAELLAGENLPFEFDRLTHGGFKPLVHTKR